LSVAYLYKEMGRGRLPDRPPLSGLVGMLV
jgi:hypothetical protein